MQETTTAISQKGFLAQKLNDYKQLTKFSLSMTGLFLQRWAICLGLIYL